MNQLRVLTGDLLYAQVDMIVQQCNCITKSTHGLSKSIKDILNVDPYGHRRLIKGKKNCAIKEDRAVPGTTLVYDRSAGVEGPRYVACLFAQFSPGKPGIYHQDQLLGVSDSSEQRLSWFKESLKDLERYVETITRDQSPSRKIKIAFPCFIGCGLAGGDWGDYQKAIEEWSNSYQGVDVSIIRKL